MPAVAARSVGPAPAGRRHRSAMSASRFHSHLPAANNLDPVLGRALQLMAPTSQTVTTGSKPFT